MFIVPSLRNPALDLAALNPFWQKAQWTDFKINNIYLRQTRTVYDVYQVLWSGEVTGTREETMCIIITPTTTHNNFFLLSKGNYLSSSLEKIFFYFNKEKNRAWQFNINHLFYGLNSVIYQQVFKNISILRKVIQSIVQFKDFATQAFEIKH